MLLHPASSKEKGECDVSARARLLPDKSGKYRLIPDVEHGDHHNPKDAYLNPETSEEFYDEILRSVGFNLFISGLIVANAIVIGLETDNQEEQLWAILEFVFLGIFTLELALRLIVSGPKKFFSYNNDDFSWTRAGRRSCGRQAAWLTGAPVVRKVATSKVGDDGWWNLFDFCVVFAGCLDVISDMSPVRHEKAGSVD
eukprot:Skav231681  [mRNA]  locus=scaffold597:606103:613424:+ [translate_table: standard]